MKTAIAFTVGAVLGLLFGFAIERSQCQDDIAFWKVAGAAVHDAMQLAKENP